MQSTESNFFCVFPFQLPDGQRFPPTRWQRGLLVWRAGNRDTQSEAVRPVATSTWALLCKNVNKFTGIRIEGSNCLSRLITFRRGVSLPPIFNIPKSLAPVLSPPIRPRAGSTLWGADLFSSGNELTLTYLSTIYIIIVVHYSMPLRFLPKFRFWH